MTVTCSGHDVGSSDLSSFKLKPVVDASLRPYGAIVVNFFFSHRVVLSVFQDINSVYQIFPDEVLGSGQFGIVYGGEDQDLNQVQIEH